MKHRRRSLLYVALASGAFSGVTPAFAQTDTVRVRSASTLEAQVARLAREINTQRRIQAELERSLAQLQLQRDAADEKQLQSLREQFALATASVQTLRQRLETLCSSDEKPRGWLGVTLQGKLTVERQGNGPAVLMYDEHPRVESVEPGSPAEKAGVASGDIILAMAGRDVRTGEVIPSELLRPGERLPLRIRRANAMKVITVLVEPRPESFADAPCPWMDHNIAMAMARPAIAYGFVMTDSGAPRVVLRRPPSPAIAPTPSAGQAVATTAPPTPAPMPAPPAEATVFVGPFVSGFTSGNTTVAGAQLMPMNPDLGANFGVDEGLLVLKVLQGTIAQNAGLKSGDVLISADDQPLATLSALQHVLMASSDHVVKLVVMRMHKRQTVTLRWPR